MPTINFGRKNFREFSTVIQKHVHVCANCKYRRMLVTLGNKNKCFVKCNVAGEKVWVE